MKNTFKVAFALSLAVLASVGLTACDDDNSTSGVTNQFVIGNDG